MEAILLKLGWAVMTRTNVIVSFFLGNGKNTPANQQSIIRKRKRKRVRKWLFSYILMKYGFQIVIRMPSIPIYIRKANYGACA